MFVAYGPILFIIYLYYGHWVSQSVITKSHFLRPDFIHLIRDIFFPHIFNYILFPLAIFGIVRFIRKTRYFMIIGIWLMLYAGAYCIRGPCMLNWYIYSIEVIQLIFAALAVSEIQTMVRSGVSENKLFWISALFAVGCWTIVCYKMGRSKVETNVFEALRKDLDSGQHTSLSFFAEDIGAIGYFSRGYVYDNLMLVTPQAIEYPNLRERIVHVNPDYLYLYTTETYVNMIIQDSVLSRNYHFVKRYARNGETVLPENLNQLIGSYHLDYMQWKRNK